jgi:hypothetical protein
VLGRTLGRTARDGEKVKKSATGKRGFLPLLASRCVGIERTKGLLPMYTLEKETRKKRKTGTKGTRTKREGGI